MMVLGFRQSSLFARKAFVATAQQRSASMHLAKSLCCSHLHCTTMVLQEQQQQETSQSCLSTQEARKLLNLKLQQFRQQLLRNEQDCIPLPQAIELCKQVGVAASNAEAEDITKSLDEAGELLIFRNKVFLRPKKIAELLARAMPLSVIEEDDPRREEWKRLQKEKQEIDRIARKHVRRWLWIALGILCVQDLLFIRLTFWDLSWDVMEPILFFITSSSIIGGFLFFILTSRDPSYHDLMHAIFSSKQRKLMKKRKFDIERFKELQMHCSLLSDKAQNDA